MAQRQRSKYLFIYSNFFHIKFHFTKSEIYKNVLLFICILISIVKDFSLFEYLLFAFIWGGPIFHCVVDNFIRAGSSYFISLLKSQNLKFRHGHDYTFCSLLTSLNRKLIELSVVVSFIIIIIFISSVISKKLFSKKNHHPFQPFY